MNTAVVTMPFSELAVQMRALNVLLSNPKLVETPALIEEMLRRRDELAKAEPRSDIDALILLLLAENAASGLLRGTIEELQQEGIHTLAAEILAITTTLAKAFERRIGFTADDLGLRDNLNTH